MKKKLLSVLLCAAMISTLIIGCNSTQEGKQAASKEANVTLKFGGTMSTEDICTEAMYKFQDLVAEKSGGSITVEIYPTSQLGDATTQLEAVAIGSQDMFVEASSYMHSSVSEYDLLPYFWVFNGSEHYKKFTESDLAAKLNQKYLDATGVRVLGINWIRTPRILSTNKKVTAIGDFKGMKCRVPSVGTSMSNSYTALGAAPTAIAWGEVYLALEQGVVDACDAPVDSMYSMKFYEPTNRVVLTNHIYDSLAVWINEAKFKSLSDNQKKIITGATSEIGNWYSENAAAKSKKSIELMKEAGAEVAELDKATIAEMKNAVEGVIRNLEKDGKVESGLYDEIQAMDK
ncbi:TRAP transporter substrate-binding protein [Petroclostridium sp. X23]|uniref:TRAP transporter substrate-binding protein n=1 Tax=Petroclostridium sp. X23 TaxID=3045146 RepID=UPI0024ACB423|nr:TRAP transporter substrate-binding protein [Petroclostridium sp. X23]WHH60624.1 TRAP transporter substrate-binding protein [Petroclostridium sp. X23]